MGVIIGMGPHQRSATIARRTRALDKELTELVTGCGSPDGTTRHRALRRAWLLAHLGDIHRFASRDRFASWNGTQTLPLRRDLGLRHQQGAARTSQASPQYRRFIP